MYIGVSVMEARKTIGSDRSVSSHKADDKEYLISVKNYPMLYLMVRPHGTKSWIYRYLSPTHSKNKRISLGVYPNVSFSRACEIWRDYEELLSRKKDLLELIRLHIGDKPISKIASLRMLEVLLCRYL